MTKDALYASPRTYFAIKEEASRLYKLADNVDIFLTKKNAKDKFSGASIDLIVKVKEKRPQADTLIDKVLNFIKKPILKSEQEYAGMNFGMFDSPLKVATKLKEKLIKNTKTA